MVPRGKNIKKPSPGKSPKKRGRGRPKGSGGPQKIKIVPSENMEPELFINGLDLQQLETLAMLGLTDEQICLVLRISVKTFYNYRKQNPIIEETLKRGKVVADTEVMKSLYKSACGYDVVETEKKYKKPPAFIENPEYNKDKKGSKKYIPNPNTEPELVQEITTTKHVPPNSTSIIFWSINRIGFRRGDLRGEQGGLDSEETEKLRLLASGKMEENI